MTEVLIHCPLCGFHNVKQYRGENSRLFFIQCERCGEYEASKEMLGIFKDVTSELDKIGYALSGLARELYETEQQIPIIKSTNYMELANSFPVPDLNSVEEKMKKLVQRVKEKTTHFGEEVDLGDVEIAYPLAYAKNSTEFWALCDVLQQRDILLFKKYQLINTLTARVQLTAYGWDFSRKLESEVNTSSINTRQRGSGDAIKTIKQRLEIEGLFVETRSQGGDQHLLIGKRDGTNEKAHVIIDEKTGEIRIEDNQQEPTELVAHIESILTLPSGKKIRTTREVIEELPAEIKDGAV